MNTLTWDELKQMNEVEHEDFVLINVLPKEKFVKKHIRTSINVPVDSSRFIDTVEKIAGDKQRKLVVYCANFECDASEKAVEQLEKAGFDRV